MCNELQFLQREAFRQPIKFETFDVHRMEEILLTRLDERKVENGGRTNGRENGKNSRKYRFLDRFAGVGLQLGCVARKRDRLGRAFAFSFKDRSNASDVNEHSSRRNRGGGGGGGGGAAAAAVGKEEEEEEEIVAPFFFLPFACYLLRYVIANTVSSSVSSVTTYESRLSQKVEIQRARAHTKRHPAIDLTILLPLLLVASATTPVHCRSKV